MCILKRVRSSGSNCNILHKIYYNVINGIKLLIVDESYTSCTSGARGKINKMRGNETYLCQSCGLEINRDAIASRNILIKNSTLR